MMMASGGEEQDFYPVELLQCSVCQGYMINKQPQILSCGHTLCSSCHQQMCEGDIINCTKCRSSLKLSRDGKKSLSKYTEMGKKMEQLTLSERNDMYKMVEQLTVSQRNDKGKIMGQPTQSEKNDMGRIMEQLTQSERKDLGKIVEQPTQSERIDLGKIMEQLTPSERSDLSKIMEQLTQSERNDVEKMVEQLMLTEKNDKGKKVGQLTQSERNDIGKIMEQLTKSARNEMGKVMEELAQSERNECLCQMCRNKDTKLEYICITCSKKLICQECYEKHQKIPAMKAHEILPRKETQPAGKVHQMCEKHAELFEYFCCSCVQPLCAICTCDSQHEEHCEHILDYEAGVQELIQSMDKLHEAFKENTKKAEVCAKILEQEMDSLKESKAALSAKCKDVAVLHVKLKQQLCLINELDEPLRTASHRINKVLADVEMQMAHMNSNRSEADFIDHWGKCKLIMNTTEEITNKKIVLPVKTKKNCKLVELVKLNTRELCLKEKIAETLCGYKPKERQTKSFRKKSRYTATEVDKHEELVLEIKPDRSIDIEIPLEVVGVGDGTVILVDYNLNYLQRIDTEGNIVNMYNFKTKVNHRSACVYGEYLFVATSDNLIRKMPLDGCGYSEKYKPEGVNIGYISAIEDNVILISEVAIDSRIIEYNTDTNHVTQRIQESQMPGKVGVYKKNADTKYIVKMADGWRTNVYNKNWNLIFSIDKYPDGLTVSPDGSLFLAHDNKIYEYTHEGHFMREMFKDQQFHQIKDITLSGGYLWVLEKHPCCIKIYKNLMSEL